MSLVTAHRAVAFLREPRHRSLSLSFDCFAVPLLIPVMSLAGDNVIAPAYYDSCWGQCYYSCLLRLLLGTVLITVDDACYIPALLLLLVPVPCIAIVGTSIAASAYYGASIVAHAFAVRGLLGAHWLRVRKNSEVKRVGGWSNPRMGDHPGKLLRELPETKSCGLELTKQLPRVVTDPGIAPASNSLNFGVPTNPKPVSSQKASYYIDARVVTHPGIAPASNSLNFGVPTNPKPVSSQKASYYIDARCAI
ncbi:hypothetical protein L3X38_015826 [Prunus dulcis]|uniref:Uncharacterized protein n=1 Tax=Prunus dulcis TaxID=3755 RepID=A0AAD4W492_PRUDU|nr:hypothetical protein L3X38_015826 [Prunus dulcis]